MGVVRLFFGVAGDDLIFDLVVGGFGKDASGEELVFGGVGTTVDDAFRVGVADAGKGFELVHSRGVDVDLVGCGGGRLSGGGGFGLGYGAERKGKKERGGQKLMAKKKHGCASLKGVVYMRKSTRVDRVRQ
jgi:hypothetical protein